MKNYTIIKIGYRYTSNSGCLGEYFNCIMVNGSKQNSFCFGGLYGAEERVARAMEKKGWKQFYTPSYYGKMTRKDVATKWVMNEYDAVEFVKGNFKRDYE